MTQTDDEAEQADKDKNSGMRVTDKGVNNSSDYMFRKRKAGRNLPGEGSAVEKYNLRIKQRIEFDRKMEQRAKEQASDPYDDLDDYSPDRLKTTRNTRALTRKLNHKY